MSDGVWHFGVLGPLQIEREGTVSLPSGRQRSLLALLLLQAGAPISRDRLIDELWGEDPPASAVSALHVHLSKLRSLLEGALVLESAGYRLAAGAFELDASRFDALVDEARATPERARELLAEALSLFRGDPLSDVASEGSVAQWRRALEEKRLQAVLMRLDADLAAGDAGELIAELEQLAVANPYSERVWSLLMLALYRSGRQADALEVFQRARRVLAEELGLDPGAQLSRLQQQILARDETLSLAATEPDEPPSPAPAAPATPTVGLSNLPRPLTRTVGRDQELAELAALMADPDMRLLTLTGPGGVGKTRLLLELAGRHEGDATDGTVFVRLEALTDPALVAAEIAGSLARRDGADGPGADNLEAYLRNRELLMVIDNFEHLLAAAVLIAELLASAPRLRVLISSRTPLRIRGEQTVPVQPLALPIDDSAEAIADSPAVALFVQRAHAANRALAFDAQPPSTIADICRAVDGLPLAIELAAARAQTLSPAEIAEQLARPLLIGERALRDLPERQQTLQATIRWSYDLLAPEAQQVLRGAGVFLGGFTPEALEAVVGMPIGGQLSELLEASLVRRGAQERRFELLELVRAFALDELAAREPQSPARGRHRHYFAALVAPTREAFDSGGAPSELAAPLLADHANLRAALEDAIESVDGDAAAGLALGLRPVWLAGMLRQESQELVERLLKQVPVSGEDEIALLRAAAFLQYGESGAHWHHRVAARAAELGDLETLALATGNLFGQALNRRDRDEMRRLRPELEALITAEGSARAVGWMHYFLALDAYVDGRPGVAVNHAALSSEKGAEIGHEFMLGSAVGTRILARSAHEHAMDVAELAEVLDLMARPGVQPLTVFALWLVARYAAGVEPQTAARWLAYAEPVLATFDSQLWPESVLRDETMAVLGLTDLTELMERTPRLDHQAALAEGIAWVAQRPPGERSPRADPIFFTAAD